MPQGIAGTLGPLCPTGKVLFRCGLAGHRANSNSTIGPRGKARRQKRGADDGMQSVPAFEAFMRRFGDTYYGDLAKVRVAELKHIEAAKQAADAARKKAEDEARAKADGKPNGSGWQCWKTRSWLTKTQPGKVLMTPFHHRYFPQTLNFGSESNNMNDPKNFEDYLELLSNGRFAILAKRKLEVLKAAAIKSNPERRVALVIGNSKYRVGGTLKNPVEDAAAMQVALHRLNFDLIVGQDLTFESFQEKMREFTKAMKNADVALFFYAGHGIQYKDQNYLLPTDVELKNEVDIAEGGTPQQNP